MEEVITPGYTRISSIAGAFSSYGTVPKVILNNARERGTAVHSIVKDLIQDIPVEDERYVWHNTKMNGDVDIISLKGYIESFQRFWQPYEQSAYSFPERLYEDILKTTGEVDLVTQLDGERILIDWKCTAAKSESWNIQANGYTMLYEENYGAVIDTMLFVRLDKDGKMPEIIEIAHDVDLFYCAYEMYHRFFKNQVCNLEME